MIKLCGMLPGKRIKQEAFEEQSPTKEKILQAAEELFAEKGFEGARTRDIAERAGVNISTLHFHWKSKEELYHAVYRRLLAYRANQAQEVFGLLQEMSASHAHWEEVVQAVVDKMLSFFHSHPYAARLDTHRILETNMLSSTLEQEEASSLLTLVAERLRTLLPGELSGRMDIELTILTLNAFLREYFTNPAAFAYLLGEKNPKALQERLKHHVRQTVARLFDLV